MSGTRRQRIAALLRQEEWGFEALREELEVPVAVLQEDLRHIERSVRSEGERLRTTPARCSDCGFLFRGRVGHHFAVPGRCPECRGERIEGPWYRVS